MRKITLLLLSLLVFMDGWVRAQTREDLPQPGATPYTQLLLHSFENDGGLTTINSVPDYQCATTITPAVEIINDGSNILTSASLKYYIDSNFPQTIQWNGWLEPGAVDTIVLPAISVTAGFHELTISIVEANGTVDINDGNNNDVIEFYIVGTSIIAPVSQQFDNGILPDGYFVENPDKGPTWQIYQAADEQGPLNYMMQMHFYYSYAGNTDEFYLKNIDLSNGIEAFMNFDVAYKYYQNTTVEYYDELQVLASSDCGNNWDVLYDKGKDDLATLPPDDVEFFVTGDPSQWRTEFVDLNNYAGNPNLMIRFEAVSGHGNNLYIDNINIASVTGMGDVNEKHSSIQLFPNPANEQVSMKINGYSFSRQEIRVINCLGQNCYTSTISSTMPVIVNTSDWKPGMYFVNLISNGTFTGTEKLNVIH